MIAFTDKSRILQPNGMPFGRVRSIRNEYEATQDKHRRQATSTLLKSEDKVLGLADRKKLLSNARDLRRNFSDAAWAIRKHLDFVSTFSFQARTDDDVFNEEVEAWMREISQPYRFEVAEKHRLDRFFRLAEASRVVDGDVFILKLLDGRVQAVEGDRIRTAGKSNKTPRDYNPEQFTHGIEAMKSGKHIRYCIMARAGSSFEFETVLMSRFVIPYGFYDRFDQLRGITPLSSALNQWRDVYEGREYALLKAKVAQLFGLKLTTSSDGMTPQEPIGHIYDSDAESGQTEDSAGKDPGGYEYDFTKGPQLIDLTESPGADADFLENRTPSTEFQSFDKMIVAAALKSLDIPYSFYDESHTNFFGSKGALQQYLYSVAIKRADHVELRDSWLRWRIGIAVAEGELTLPRGRDFAWLRWQWIPKGLPWWKPLEEVKAQIEAIGGGLLDVPAACQERGEDAMDVARRQVRYEVAVRTLREENGLPPLGGQNQPMNPAETVPAEER
ncbi:MAG TPA: phage portal protein [Phycisphaerae bacterium]|nr:phage portal protein [Phycisphaerae bacterium]